MSESLWQKTASKPARPPLDRDIFCDVCVIGAGMTGMLTAYYLTRAGLDVVVLEADTIGSGTTGGTTGKITSQHARIYTKLVREKSAETARRYAACHERAIKAYADLIAEQGIDCDFERKRAYLYTHENPELIQRECACARIAGIDAHLTRDTGLPFPAYAMIFPRQAQFHPLKFLYAMADKVAIYEHSTVLTVKGSSVTTAHGRVSAKHIVFACRYPFINLPGLYFAREHQSRAYLLALEDAPTLDGMYFSADSDGTTMRSYDRLLLFGGQSHRTGRQGNELHFDRLENTARAYFGTVNTRSRWSVQDAIPVDGLPYIGKYSAMRPDWYIATGFNKWGMSTAMAAAQILTRMICGKASAYADLFSPARFSTGAANGVATESAVAVRELTREIFGAPDCSVGDIPPGQARIVNYHGQKAGVYRDESGELYAVDTRCPHLGCQLEWNADEKSWDCPCHGSRFDIHGNLLSGPAQTELPHQR